MPFSSPVENLRSAKRSENELAMATFQSLVVVVVDITYRSCIRINVSCAGGVKVKSNGSAPRTARDDVHGRILGEHLKLSEAPSSETSSHPLLAAQQSIQALEQ